MGQASGRGQVSFYTDEQLKDLLTSSNGEVSRLAQDLITVRAGVRKVMDSEFIMWEERSALEELLK